MDLLGPRAHQLNVAMTGQNPEPGEEHENGREALAFTGLARKPPKPAATTATLTRVGR